MNILGYIFAILVLVSIAFQSYYTNCLYDRNIQQSYNGRLKACKNLQKVYIEHNFKQIPEKPLPKRSPSCSNKKMQAPKIFLKEEKTPSCMRLNLWPILNQNDASHCIYRSLVRLITTLYSPDLIDSEHIPSFTREYLSLLSKKMKDPNPLYLEQIEFSNPLFQRIYYQMLSDEHSLLNYIKLNPDQKICLACADELMLQVLFNQEIKDRCLSTRSHPMQKLSISKDLLDQWIRLYGLDPSLSSYIRYKHSKKDASEKILKGKDLPTDIVLKQKVSSFAKSPKTHKRESQS